MKPPKKDRRRTAHKTQSEGDENPLFTLMKAPEFLKTGDVVPIDIESNRMAADLLIQAALVGCTTTEKLLIATAIPVLLSVIRPKKTAGKSKPVPVEDATPVEAEDPGEANL